MKKDLSEPISAKKSGVIGSIRHTFDSLEDKRFRILWFGMLFSQASMQINIVARSWLAYSISGSAFALGLVALARGLPQSFLSLLGGAIADRADKRILLVMVQFSMSALAIVNALLVHLNMIQVWHLIVIGFFQGVIFVFNIPTRQALIAELVDKKMLSNALALNSTGMNLNRFLAPSLAGLLLASHPAVAFDVVALFYSVSAFLLLRLPRNLSVSAARSYNALKDISDGLLYIYRNKKLLGLIIMAFVPTLIGLPYRQLLPVFQQDVLHVGPSALGFMYTMVGVGALIGSLMVATLSQSERLQLIQGASGIFFGLFLVLFALSSTYSLSLMLLTIVGLASQGYMTLNSILIMKASDQTYYGRVMSLYVITFSMGPVAMLPIGFFVDRFGPQPTEVTAGILLAIIMTIFHGFIRRNRS